MSLWWLSFVDRDRPEGERSLGVALVEIEDVPDTGLRERVAAVVRRAWQTGCNPGGEVASYEIPVENLPNAKRLLLAKVPHHVLMSREQLIEHGLVEP